MKKIITTIIASALLTSVMCHAQSGDNDVSVWIRNGVDSTTSMFCYICCKDTTCNPSPAFEAPKQGSAFALWKWKIAYAQTRASIPFDINSHFLSCTESNYDSSNVCQGSWGLVKSATKDELEPTSFADNTLSTYDEGTNEWELMKKITDFKKVQIQNSTGRDVYCSICKSFDTIDGGKNAFTNGSLLKNGLSAYSSFTGDPPVQVITCMSTKEGQFSRCSDDNEGIWQLARVYSNVEGHKVVKAAPSPDAPSKLMGQTWELLPIK